MPSCQVDPYLVLFFSVRPGFYNKTMLPMPTHPDTLDNSRVPMPAYCFQDCHYFYRSALRHLNIATSISPLYA